MLKRNLSLANLMAGLLLAGCGSGTGGNDTTSSLGQTLINGANTPVVGKVFLGADVAGATVRLESLDGSIAIQQTTDSTGGFLFRNDVPSDFRLKATVGGLTFSKEVRNFGPDQFQVINVPNTLVSLLVQGGRSLGDAQERVRAELGLPTTSNLDLIEDSVVQPFSHLAFFVAANKAGGVVNLATQLANAGSGSSIHFLLRQEAMASSLTGLDPGLVAVLNKVRQDPDQQRAIFRLLSRGSANLAFGTQLTNSQPVLAKAAAGELLSFVGEGISSSILDAGIDASYTWLAEQMGWHFGTTVTLDEILETTNEINSGVNELLKDADLAALGTLTSTASTDISDVSLQVSEMIQAINTIYPADDPTDPNSPRHLADPNYFNNQPAPANTQPAAVTTFLSSAQNSTNLNNYIAYLHEFAAILTGGNRESLPIVVQNNTITTNVLAAARKLVLEDQYGISVSDSIQPKFAYFPVRSAALLDQVLSYYEYYANFASQTSLLLAQAAASSTDQVNVLNNARNELDDVTRSLLNARSQVPLYPPSDDLLIDLEYGLIWYMKPQASSTYANALTTAANYVLPLSNGESYSDWRLPTYNEVKALQQRGVYATAAHDSSGVDYGTSVNGLSLLGFDTSSINSDGDIWCQNWQYENPVFGSPSWTSQSDGLEFQLNHETSNFIYDTADSSRPFILVRSIGAPLIKIDPPNTISGPQDTWPSQLTNTIQSWEYPYIGVFTGFSSPQVSGLVAQTLSNFSYFTGGTFTLAAGTDSGTGSTDLTGTNSVSGVSARPVPYLTISDTSVATISNYPDSWGTVTPGRNAASGATITFHAVGYANSTFPSQISGSTPVSLAASSIHLRQLQISQRNVSKSLENGQPGTIQFIATGFYTDTQLKNLTGNVQWTVTDSNGNAVPGAVFANDTAGLLKLDPTQLTQSNLVVKAVLNDGQDQATDTTLVSLALN